MTIHNFDALLFYTGLFNEMAKNPVIANNFSSMNVIWKETELRYSLPVPKDHDLKACQDIDNWLNDPHDGVITFLKGHV